MFVFPQIPALGGSHSFQAYLPPPVSHIYSVSVCQCRFGGAGVLTWLSEVCMGLRMGEPAGLQSSGKGLGMAGREAGRRCCSSCRHLQGETHTLMSLPWLTSEILTILCGHGDGCHLGIEKVWHTSYIRLKS